MTRMRSRSVQSFNPWQSVMQTGEWHSGLEDGILLHRDPFDRLLFCQALEYDMTLVTVDGALKSYSVPTISCLTMELL